MVGISVSAHLQPRSAHMFSDKPVGLSHVAAVWLCSLGVVLPCSEGLTPLGAALFPRKV